MRFIVHAVGLEGYAETAVGRGSGLIIFDTLLAGLSRPFIIIPGAGAHFITEDRDMLPADHAEVGIIEHRPID